MSPALSYAETNNNSIVIRLLHGDNSFLFTGDAEVQAQQEMAYGGYELKSDVMKIPHHGGKSSYQRWFYNEVLPTYAVISCGKENNAKGGRVETKNTYLTKLQSNTNIILFQCYMLIKEGSKLQNNKSQLLVNQPKHLQ